ncbi:MAG: hypothetical protein HQM12_19165 [SAR324 cluster bacterium]|nr:hypothetical protein [SAR324 cluster bacterium]
MKWISSLKNMLTLQLILVILVPLLISSSIILFHFTRTLEDEINSQHLLLSETLTYEILNFLYSPQRTLQDVVTVMEHDLVSISKRSDYLENILKNHTYFERFDVIDSQGKMLYTVPLNPDLTGNDMSLMPFFVQALKNNGIYWSDTFMSPKIHYPVVTLSIAQGQYVIVGYLNLFYLRGLVEKIVSNTGSQVVIADQNGTIIAHHDEKMIMERVNIKQLKLPVNSDSIHDLQLFQGNLMGIISTVKPMNWRIAVYQHESHIFAKVEHVNEIILLIVGTTLVIALCVAMFSMNSALRPLLHFTESTKKVTEGVYEPIQENFRYSEIRTLLENFNAMIHAIATREEVLRDNEIQIREHNKSLAQAVKIKTVEMETLAKRLVRREKLATVGQITGNIAHELRNPLSSLKNAVYYMKRRPDTKLGDVTQFLDIMDHEINTATHVLEDLLDLTRIKELALAQVDLKSMVYDTLRYGQLKERIELRYESNPEEFIIRVDPVQMRQVFLNLFTNAADVSTEMGIVQVTALRNEELQMDEIRIQDFGSGIAAERLEEIFEPLYTTKRRGTGLGLSICKQIIEKHNGEITAQSEVSKGTVMIIRIPVTQAPPTPSLLS